MPKNPNPLVTITLEAIIWAPLLKALRASPEAGNYEAAAGGDAIDQALRRAGVNPDEVTHV